MLISASVKAKPQPGCKDMTILFPYLANCPLEKSMFSSSKTSLSSIIACWIARSLNGQASLVLTNLPLTIVSKGQSPWLHRKETNERRSHVSHPASCACLISSACLAAWHSYGHNATRSTVPSASTLKPKDPPWQSSKREILTRSSLKRCP